MEHSVVAATMQGLGQALKERANGKIDHKAMSAQLKLEAKRRPGFAEHVNLEAIRSGFRLIFDDGEQRYIHEETASSLPQRSEWEYGAPGTDQVAANRSLPPEDQVPVANLRGQITRDEWQQGR